MHDDPHSRSLFDFVHPDHAWLPRSVRRFWNGVGLLLFFAPPFMGCTSGLGVVLGLSRLEEICPALAQGMALGVIALVKVCAIAFASLFVTADIYGRHELAHLIREDIYEMIEEHIVPLFR
ncbi:hypothetical protein AB4Y32_30580 [Paraburkholderia phymatum]|uniref:Uncharacterized protein n=1 Tax=Paraburkholderia phymatum TaxID=148447 RepID=A0ACC6U8U7_9BURK